MKIVFELKKKIYIEQTFLQLLFQLIFQHGLYTYLISISFYTKKKIYIDINTNSDLFTDF